jgi:drug/metabolite transporter (DMT)-like permease
MVTASAMFAVMGALVYQVKVLDPSASSLTASFFRVLVNLLFVVAIASRKGLRQGIKELVGDKRPSLWARGVFGALALMFVFASIHMIGIGEASFLNGFSAFWIAILSPIVLGQPNSKLGWCAILLGLCGLYLLYQPEFGEVKFVGRTLGLASGALAGGAYMMVARAGRSNSSVTVVFYLCLVAICFHLAWFAVAGFTGPANIHAWCLLIFAGIAASIAQLFLTNAFQLIPATLAAAASYATPVFNLIISALVFSSIPNRQGLIGASIILLSGIALPFLQSRKTSHHKISNSEKLVAGDQSR